MEIKFKTWLEKDGEVVAGGGKMHFLKMIEETGSIQRAAQKMAMSYRHAWGFIKKIEKHSGIRFVETQVGGKEGGGAWLTPEGKKFVERYFAFEEGLEDYIKSKFKTAFSSEQSAVSKNK